MLGYMGPSTYVHTHVHGNMTRSVQDSQDFSKTPKLWWWLLGKYTLLTGNNVPGNMLHTAVCGIVTESYWLFWSCLFQNHSTASFNLNLPHRQYIYIFFEHFFFYFELYTRSCQAIIKISLANIFLQVHHANYFTLNLNHVPYHVWCHLWLSHNCSKHHLCSTCLAFDSKSIFVCQSLSPHTRQHRLPMPLWNKHNSASRRHVIHTHSQKTVTHQLQQKFNFLCTVSNMTKPDRTWRNAYGPSLFTLYATIQ